MTAQQRVDQRRADQASGVAPPPGRASQLAEDPWMPGPQDLPWTICLVNPQGDRHLGFNDEQGRFYRLRQHRQPEPLHTGDAILLRPSDIDQIIKVAVAWVARHPTDPRSSVLCDEIAAGAKAAVLHFVGIAQRA